MLSRTRRLCCGMASLTTVACGLVQAQSFGEVETMWPSRQGELAGPFDVGDIDGDGAVDLVLDSAVLLGLGDGRFVLGPPPPWRGGAEDVVAIDVDLDGDLDVARTSGGTFELWLNDGRGNFLSGPGIPQTAGRLHFADLSRDGLPELLTTTRSGPGTIYENQLPTGFVASSTWVLSGEPAVCEATGDLNLDGWPDLVLGFATPQGTSPVKIFHTSPTGFSEVPHSSYTELDRVASVVIGEFSFDGWPDIWMATRTRSELWRSQGPQAPFARAFSLEHPTWVLHAFDRNGDGWSELIEGGEYADRLWEARIGMGYHDVDLSYSQQHGLTTRIRTADLDGDGDPEVIRQVDRSLQILFDDGGRRYLDPNTSTSFRSGGVAFFEAHDLDSDGAPELLVANFGRVDPTGVVFFGQEMHANDGTGRMTNATHRLRPGMVNAQPLGLEVGDVDGDSSPDLLWNHVLGTTLSIGDGSGSYLDESHRLPSFGTMPADLALGDVDGDSDLDLVQGMQVNGSPPGAAPDRLLINQGHGWFLERPNAFPMSFATARTELLDIDGDGDLDLLALEESTSLSGVWHFFENDGSGSFSDRSNLVQALPKRVEFGDMDGDGDLDAVGFVDRIGPVYFNDGSGRFSQGNQALSFPSVQQPRLLDFDGDGDLDAAFLQSAYQMPSEIHWAENDGTGRFARTTPLGLLQEGLQIASFEFTDLDRDGDRDLLIALVPWESGPTIRVLRNLDHQLSWTSPARSGRLLEFAIRGEAGAVAWLGASPHEVQNPLPPLGTLRLDPATTSFALPVTLDPGGMSTLQFLVPRQPAFLGVVLHWQALLSGQRPVLSNLTRTTVLGY